MEIHSLILTLSRLLEREFKDLVQHIAMLQYSTRRVRIGTAARKRMEERFSAKVVAEQSVRWYEKVIAGDRQKGKSKMVRMSNV